MSRTAGLDFVCSRMSLRRLLARVVRQHFIICPFGGLHSIRANMLPHNALQSPDRMQYPHCRQKILWKRGDSNSRYQSSTLPYILHHEVLDFQPSSCFRFPDFSTLPTGWLQQPHFAKCAWSLGTKQLYSAVMMYGNPCVVLFAQSQIRVASPSARIEETLSKNGGAMDPLGQTHVVVDHRQREGKIRLNRPLAGATCTHWRVHSVMNTPHGSNCIPPPNR